MRILNLIAENVKKVRVVEITPKGDIVTIAGRNGQGKTSILDSLWLALDHTKVPAVMPIRKGENKARVRLTLGTGETAELVVERRFNEKGSTLTVESATGARFPSPQKMLDALLGELSFDPLAFARMEPREQFDELRRISQVEVDIDELDGLNRADYGKRTDLNRDAKAKRAQADGIVIAANLPDAPLDERALLDEMEKAGETNMQIEQRKARREQAQREAHDLELRAAEQSSQSAKLHNEADAAARRAAELLEQAAELGKKINEAPALPDPVDVPAIRARLEHARQVNVKLNERTRKASVIAEAELIESRAADLTATMEAREKTKLEAIAKAKMPVEGLGFGAGAVTYQGVPFDQASSAEQLRVSLSIAMAANPKLRVIRIQDGSLLDADSRAAIADMAKAGDYQVWIEVVQADAKVGILIEDGSVVAVDGAPPPPPVEKKDKARAEA